MPTITATPIVPDLAAWCLKRLLSDMDLAGVDPATLPGPWDAIALAVQGADPKDRSRVLSRELLDRGLDPQAVSVLLMQVNQNDPPPKPKPPRYVRHHIREALQKPAPVKEIVEGWIRPRSVNALVGDGGTGKTIVAQWLLLRVGSGESALGMSTTKTPCLYLDQEIGEEMFIERMHSLLAGMGFGPGDESRVPDVEFISMAGFDFRKPEDVAEVELAIEDTNSGLVVLDSQMDFLWGADENSSSDMTLLYQTIRAIAFRTGCAFLVIHHTNRQGKFRGSSAIKHQVDTMLNVEADEADMNNPGVKVLHFVSEKTRSREPLRFDAKITFGIFDIRVDLLPTPVHVKTPHYSKSEDYVIRFLTGKGQATMAEIEANADVCSPQAARRATYTLVSKKVVERVNPGKQGVPAIYAMAPVDPFDAAMNIGSVYP